MNETLENKNLGDNYSILPYLYQMLIRVVSETNLLLYET